MAARSSQDLACCWRATPRARSKKKRKKNASVKGGQELIVDLVRIVVRLCLASCRSGHKAFGLFGCEFGGGLMRRIVLAALITSLAVGTAAAQSCDSRAVGRERQAPSWRC